MSIDSDLSNGLITEDEARKRREEIRKEADFYGAMDGASKFVQGDVKVAHRHHLHQHHRRLHHRHGDAGRVLRRGAQDLHPADHRRGPRGADPVAAHHHRDRYHRDPRRVQRKPRATTWRTSSARSRGRSSSPRPRWAAAILIPGFPKISLLITRGRAWARSAYVLIQSQEEETAEGGAQGEGGGAARSTSRRRCYQLVQVDPLEVEIGYNLIPLVDPEQGGTLLDRITNIRRRSALDMGLIVPPIRIRDNMELESEGLLDPDQGRRGGPRQPPGGQAHGHGFGRGDREDRGRGVHRAGLRPQGHLDQHRRRGTWPRAGATPWWTAPPSSRRT